MGIKRGTKNLKEKYENLKRKARKSLAGERRELYKTGGGRNQSYVDPNTERVAALLGQSATGFDNSYDSDDQSTVLLVYNATNQRSNYLGVHINVRPDVGLLTTTARTFIQNGVTTEYATQMVGTTLNKGRLYTQFLKKSSRTLYDNLHQQPFRTFELPSVTTSWVRVNLESGTEIASERQNDILNAHKSSESTDFINFSNEKHKKTILGKKTETTLNPGTTKNKDNPSNIIETRLTDILPIQAISRAGQVEESGRQDVNKVLPLSNLPTYTVRNIISPREFFKQTSVKQRQLTQHSNGYGNINSLKLYKKNSISNEVYSNEYPKLYYKFLADAKNNFAENVEEKSGDPLVHEVLSGQLSTITYYGFADFTTVVGGSLIVFSPAPPTQNIHFAHATTVQGESTPDCIIKCNFINTNPVIGADGIKNRIAPEPSIKTKTLASKKVGKQSENVNNCALPQTQQKSLAPKMKECGKILLNIVYKDILGNDPSTHLAGNRNDNSINIVEIGITSQASYSIPSDHEVLELYASLSRAEASSTSLVREQPNMHIFSNHENSNDKPKENKENRFIMPLSTFEAKSTPDVVPVNASTEQISGISVVTVNMKKHMLHLEGEEITESKSKGVEFGKVSIKPIAMFYEAAGSDDCSAAKSNQINNDSIACLIISQNLFSNVAQSKTDFNSLYETNFKRNMEFYNKNETEILPSFNILGTPVFYSSTTRPFETFTSKSSSQTNLFDIPHSEKQSANILLKKKKNDDNKTIFEYQELSEHDQDTANQTNTNSNKIVYSTGDDADEGIELLYKTLFTTYTYLTTFFNDKSRTSILTHHEIFTNIVTSTLKASAGDIFPTNVTAEVHSIKNISADKCLNDCKSAKEVSYEKTTNKSKFILPEVLEAVLRESGYNKKITAKNNVSDESSFFVTSLYDKIQTYFTTYTYYTTIFVGDVTKIISRTAVQTNYYTAITTPTKIWSENETTIDLFRDIASPIKAVLASNKLTNNRVAIAANKTLQNINNEYRLLWYVTTLSTANNESNQDLSKNASVALFIDSSLSNANGNRHVLNQKNILLDDLISSESDTDEITSSSTLLLRASFTTFTYYTTIYSNDMTNVVCSLETVTNIATETLYSSKIENFEEATLPITYYTTFTYWTKLAKNGVIATLSKEETISNILKKLSTPVSCLPNSSGHNDVNTITQKSYADMQSAPLIDRGGDSEISYASKVVEHTTYYTTYTYYRTSYDFDQAIIDSRYEIIVNILTPTIPPAIASQLDTAIYNDTDVDNHNSISKKASTFIGMADITATLSHGEMQFYDSKKLNDIEADSKLYFTTVMLPTISVETSSSAYSLHVDEEQGILLPSSSKIIFNENAYKFKTALVSLIYGTNFGNYTENPYTETINTTSIFDFETNQSNSNKFTVSDIVSTKPVMGEHSSQIAATQIALLKSSEPLMHHSPYKNGGIDMSKKTDNTKNNAEEKDYGVTNAYNKTHWLFQSIKQSPVIRPFSSRNRPQLTPKKKLISPDSPTIARRIDLTTPQALKTVDRFTSPRKLGFSGSFLSREVPVGPVNQPYRRSFARPIKLPSSVGNGILSNMQAIALSSTGEFARIRLSVKPTLPSSHRVLIRPSSATSFRSLSLTENSRTRIKSTGVLATSKAKVTAQGIREKMEEYFEVPIKEQIDESFAVLKRRNQNQSRFLRPIKHATGFTVSNMHPVMVIGADQNRDISYNHSPFKSLKTSTLAIKPKTRAKSLGRTQTVSLLSRTRPQTNFIVSRALQSAQSYPKNAVQKENQIDENNVSKLDHEAYYLYEEGNIYGNEHFAIGNKRRRRSNSKYYKYEPIPLLTTRAILLRFRRDAVKSFQMRSNFRSRFHKQNHSTVSKESRYSTDHESDMLSLTTISRPRASGRSIARHSGHRKTQAGATPTASATANHYRAVKPTSPKNERAQFTLRNKNSTTAQKSYVRHNSYRRSQTTVTSQRLGAANSKNRRIKSYSSNSLSLEPPSRISSRSRNNLNRMRTTVRGRNRNEYKGELAVIPHDGTLTITHVIPAEVTIPVVSGKVTEYKNVLTARTSTELLGSHQYTRLVGSNGLTVLALIRKDSSVNLDGATEITQYVLHESPTTTVIFTPTTIRGRKTSFSHIIPSTVYSVENLISTSKPHISANAPFANILLSQLLFGNIGLRAANPFLGALGDTLVSTPINILGTQLPLTPVTEYRTHKSTYVTTLYEGTSTVIPVTFQGKKILTTVHETSSQIITATEVVTDTIITTQAQQPTFNTPNFNSLLLQQLFLQGEVQSQFEQTQQPTFSFTPLHPDLTHKLQDIPSNDIRLVNEPNNDIPSVEERQTNKAGRKKSRKSGKTKQKYHTIQEESPEDSSIITLYVSGKRPGEFSTILSTLTLSHSSTIHKRQIPGNVEQTAWLGDMNELFVTESNIMNYNKKIDLNLLEKVEHNLTDENQTRMFDKQQKSKSTHFQRLPVWNTLQKKIFPTRTEP